MLGGLSTHSGFGPARASAGQAWCSAIRLSDALKGVLKGAESALKACSVWWAAGWREACKF